MSGSLCLLVVCLVTTVLTGCSNPQTTAMHGEESGIMVGAEDASGSQNALSNSQEGILILEGSDEDGTSPGYTDDPALNNAILNLAATIDPRGQHTSDVLEEERSIWLDMNALPNTLQQQLRATEGESLEVGRTSSLLEVGSEDLENVSDLILSLERAMPGVYISKTQIC